MFYNSVVKITSPVFVGPLLIFQIKPGNNYREISARDMRMYLIVAALLQ